MSRLAATCLIVCLAACGPGGKDKKTTDTGTPTLGDCDLPKGADPVVEINHYGTFAELGDIAYCAIPPQGGAPYAPFGVRVKGLVPMDNNAAHTTITATDSATDEEVGLTDFWDAYLCANAGESAGYWIKNEFHLRFFGYTLEELHGRQVDIRFDVEGADGTLTETWRFELDCVAGD